MARYRLTIAKALALLGMVGVLACYNWWAWDAQAANAEARQAATQALLDSGPGPYAADGRFEGTSEGYGGPVTVAVTVENGWIVAVEIVDASEEDEAWLEMASVLPERILAAQTPSIDVVSGATFTSTGILNGATEALLESMEGVHGEGQ